MANQESGGKPIEEEIMLAALKNANEQLDKKTAFSEEGKALLEEEQEKNNIFAGIFRNIDRIIGRS